MEEYEKLKQMKLHEVYNPPNADFYILRVVNGWIYYKNDRSTFVPEYL